MKPLLISPQLPKQNATNQRNVIPHIRYRSSEAKVHLKDWTFVHYIDNEARKLQTFVRKSINTKRVKERLDLRREETVDLSSSTEQCSCAPLLQPLFSEEEEEEEATSRERESVRRTRKKSGLENAIIGDCNRGLSKHSVRETESVIREREKETVWMRESVYQVKFK